MTNAEPKTTTVTRYWVVCEGPFTTYCKTEAEACAKAADMHAAGYPVLRIERQTQTTTTSTIHEF